MMGRDASCAMWNAGCVWLMCLVLGSLLCVPTFAAESFPLAFQAPPGLPERASGILETLAQKHADLMTMYLELEIDTTDQACNLSQEQRAKLELAAQGAVQDSVEEWLAPILSDLATGNDLERQTLLTRLGAAAGVVHTDDGRVIELNAGNVVVVQEPNRGGFFAQLFGGGPRQPIVLTMDQSAVRNHPIFTSTLQAILTDEQQTKLAAAAEDASEDVSPAAPIVRVLVRHLGLQKDQCRRVVSLVEDVSRGPIVGWRSGQQKFTEAEVIDVLPLALPLNEMERILTPVQFAVWVEDVKQASIKNGNDRQRRGNKLQLIDSF